MNKKSLIRFLLFLLIYTVTFCIFFGTIKLTIPFIIGGMTVAALRTPTKWLSEKLRLKIGIASILMIILFYSFAIWVMFLLVSGTIYELKNITSSINFEELSLVLTNFARDAFGFYKQLDPGILDFVEQNIQQFSTSLSATGLEIGKSIIESSFLFFKNIPYLFTVVGFAIISTYFFLNDTLNGVYENDLIKNHPVYLFLIKAKNTIFKYCCSYMLVVGFTFIQVLILFYLCDVPNLIVISILCALLDILPVVGMALIILPLAISYFIGGNTAVAIILIIGYVVICALRQVIEPRVISKTMEIRPITSIIAIFVGLTANGIVGMFYCIFLVLFFKISKDMIIVADEQPQEETGQEAPSDTNEPSESGEQVDN